MNEENLKPWSKGVSGNPGGCRKDDPRAEFWRQFRSAIEEIKITLALEGKPKRPLSCVEALTRKVVKWAMAEVEWKTPIRDDDGKVIEERKETLPIPQNPQMVKLLFDKCLGNEVVLSGEIMTTGSLQPQIVDVAKLLKGLDVSEEDIAKLRKRAIAMAFPDRGLDDWSEE